MGVSYRTNDHSSNPYIDEPLMRQKNSERKFIQGAVLIWQIYSLLNLAVTGSLTGAVTALSVWTMLLIEKAGPYTFCSFRTCAKTVNHH